jgi:hypothetical protein
MEFHLPFFALREALVSDDLRSTPIGKRLRDWEDITLLTRDETEPEGQKTFRLHKAHISCVIKGSGEWQWIAWVFEDTNHEQGASDDADCHSGVDGDEDLPCQGFKEDPITCGLDANTPIRKPRQYFLKAFEIRIIKVREEWDELVHKLEVDKKENVFFRVLKSSI